MLIGVLLLLAGRAAAQSGEGERVYRFEVEGITEPAAAKLLQYTLMQRADVAWCTFIDECDCFKLATPRTLDRGALEALLAPLERRLVREVQVSDGTRLPAPDEGTDTR